MSFRLILNNPLKMLWSVITVLLSWSAWVTYELIQNEHFHNVGDRFTQKDGYEMRMELDARIDALPPPDTRQKLDDHMRMIEQNNARIVELEKKVF